MSIRGISCSLALVALVGAGCGSAASATPTPAPPAPSLPAASVGPTLEAQSPLIHLILHPANDTIVHAGTLTGCTDSSCQGDVMVGHDRLTYADTGKDAGTFSYECFLVDVGSTLYHCPGVIIELTGRGQLVFTYAIEHEPGRPAAVAPITGGTGEFLGATGSVTASVLSDGGDLVIAITK